MYAIYSRQSVDKPDSISIESQIDFCKYEIRGEEYREYSDKGYSGKNTDRPQFQQLLQDIRKGEIHKVVVYKLDRISRSILDFSNLMEMFQKYNVEFISSTEKFDTSSPLGRAMLNICIVFAQLERETIQKRVADAYVARSQKGFYMGGRVPYGFELVDTVIEGKKSAMYVINKEEAEQIKLMFELYSDFPATCGDIMRCLQERGMVNLRTGKQWERTRIADHLKSPVYVRADETIYNFYERQGVEIINDADDFIGTNGCYYYKGQNAKGPKHSELSGNVLVLAPHEGFVDSDIWLKCRIKALHNKQVQAGRRVIKAWLAGKVKCANCGHALVRKDYYKNPVASYYKCSHRQNSRDCIGCGTIYADEFEAVILNQIKQKLSEFEVLSANSSIKTNPKIGLLRAKLAEVESEIAKLVQTLSSANTTLISYANKAILELDEKKQAILDELAKTESETLDRSQVLHMSKCLERWSVLELDDKRRIVNSIIKVIHATAEKVQIEWRF